MKSETILSTHLRERYEALRDLLQKASQLAERCGHAEGAALLRERLRNSDSAALFVVVGEVKAGKSSFINALLQEHVCDVAPDPCTAGIQELVYGEERATRTLGDGVVRWEQVQLPKEVLRQITIVDTPGTNSIVKHHQAITETYIPKSDLIIFVFPATNPHTATAWDLLALINREWHRKLVFVLQQADRVTRHELTINQDRVKQYARERNVQEPVIFTLSAKREADGAPDSGFSEFRQYLRKAVETGDVWRLKVDGMRDTLRSVLSKLLADLRLERGAIADDLAFFQGLLSKLESREGKANSLKRLIVDSMSVTYDRLCGGLEEEFSQGLRIGTVLRRSLPLVRDKDMKTWLNELSADFQAKAAQEMENEAQRVSKDLAEEMKSMLEEITNEVRQRENRKPTGNLPIAEDRLALLERLHAKLESLRVADIVGEENLGALESLTLAGGGLTALGTVVAVSAKLLILDITGGILAAMGVTLLALTLWWKRSSVLSEFSQKLARSRADFRARLDTEISRMIDKLFLEVRHALQEPLSKLQQQDFVISPSIEEATRLAEATQALA